MVTQGTNFIFLKTEHILILATLLTKLTLPNQVYLKEYILVLHLMIISLAITTLGQMILLMEQLHHKEIQMEMDKENLNMHRQVDF